MRLPARQGAGQIGLRRLAEGPNEIAVGIVYGTAAHQGVLQDQPTGDQHIARRSVADKPECGRNGREPDILQPQQQVLLLATVGHDQDHGLDHHDAAEDGQRDPLAQAALGEEAPRRGQGTANRMVLVSRNSAPDE